MTVVTRVLTLAITYDDTTDGADDLVNTDWQELIEGIASDAVVTELSCTDIAASDEELRAYKDANPTEVDDND